MLDRFRGRPATMLVDVRSASEYRGDCFWPSGSMQPGGRAGHVPTARHQPIEGLYDSRGAFLPAADLAGVFASIDMEDGGELITYCTIGGRAATAWFVLTHLLGRRHVRVYDGSWAEWGLTEGAPVAGDPGTSAPFVQVIEVLTSRPEEIEAITDEWTSKTGGRRKGTRALLAADQERPHTYIQIVEFPSYDDAMENTRLPETSEFAERLAALTDAPLGFRNLEVRRVYDLG